MALTVSLSANTSWYLFNFRAATIRALRERGYRVVCLSPEDEYSQRLVSALGCEWYPLDMHNQGRNPLRDLQLVYRFFRHYRRLRPRVALHFTIKNNVYGTWAARLCGIPAINNVSGLGTAFIRQGVTGQVVRALYRSSQPFAFRVFCQNEEDERLLLGQRLVDAAKLRRLPGSGVDLQRFRPPVGREGGEPFTFLYAGRMLADKGLNELVQALRQLRAAGCDCRLLLCGFAGVGNLSAIGEPQLRQWGSEPGIEWLGSSDAMESVYALADCVVLPSYREGLPRSLLEAGAMAIPAIASDVPGCRSVVINGENGLLCAAQSVASLVESMRTMAALPLSERQRMGRNARRRVEREFDEQKVVAETLAAIDEARAGTGPAISAQ